MSNKHEVTKAIGVDLRAWGDENEVEESTDIISLRRQDEAHARANLIDGFDPDGDALNNEEIVIRVNSLAKPLEFEEWYELYIACQRRGITAHEEVRDAKSHLNELEDQRYWMRQLFNPELDEADCFI